MKREHKIAIGAGIAGITGLAIWALTKKAPPEVPPTVYTCPYCGAKFSTQEELTAHIQAEHPGKPPIYICPYCGALFVTEDALANHITLAHPPAIYTCSYCGAAFVTEEELGAHLASEHPVEIISLTWDKVPPFATNEKHIAYVKLKNPTFESSNYTAELRVGPNTATKTFWVNPLGTKTIEIPITMPSIESTYLVYLDVYVANELIAQQQFEPITLVKAAFITLLIPGTSPSPPLSPLPEPQPPTNIPPYTASVYGQTNFLSTYNEVYHIGFIIVATPGYWYATTVYRNKYEYIPLNIPPDNYDVTVIKIIKGFSEKGYYEETVTLMPPTRVKLEPGLIRIDIKFEQP